MRAITPSAAIDLPSDIYERVLALAVALTKQRQAGDERLSADTYLALRDYCESVAGQGRDHRLLWETLADFTLDDWAAIALYRRSLDLASGPDGTDPDGAVHFALALRYQAVGEVELAYQHAVKADAIGRDQSNLALRREVSQFLLNRSMEP